MNRPLVQTDRLEPDPGPIGRIQKRSLDCLESVLAGINGILWRDTTDATYRQYLKYLRLLQYKLSYKPANHIQHRDALVQGLSVLLHEPEKTCAALLTSYLGELYLLETRRGRIRTLAAMTAYRRSFSWPQEEEYARFIDRDTRSRIITCFHLGDYVNALSRLLERSGPDRNRLLIRYENTCAASRANTRLECAALKRKPATELNSKRLRPLDVVGALRRGNTTLTTFSDLTSDNGASTEVEFLGRRARFPKGPAAIALAGRSPIVPVLTYFEGGHNHIVMHPAIEPVLEPGETLDDAVTRITQILISFFDNYLRRHPDQWRYLPKLLRYFLAEPDPARPDSVEDRQDAPAPESNIRSPQQESTWKTTTSIPLSTKSLPDLTMKPV